MPRGIMNWTYSDAVYFLKKHSFVLNHIRGSHHYFIGSYKGEIHQVCVPYHGKESIKPRTMRGIIIQSGIEKDVWLK